MIDIKSGRVQVCESALSASRNMVKLAEEGRVLSFAVAVGCEGQCFCGVPEDLL